MVPKAALVLLEFQVLVPCKVLRTRIFSIIALLFYGELVLEIAPVCVRYDSSPICLSKSLLLRSHLSLLVTKSNFAIPKFHFLESLRRRVLRPHHHIRTYYGVSIISPSTLCLSK